MRTLVYDSLVELRRGGTAMFACKNRGLHEAITPAFLQDSATSGRGFLRNMYFPAAERAAAGTIAESVCSALPRGSTSQLPNRVATRASASAGTPSSGLEHLRESLAVVRMDCEDPKAHVVESRSSRRELFDPDDLGRTRDARLILQEDFDFQPRTHLHLLIRVDAQTAQIRIDPPASDENAQDGPREIYRCPNARVRRALAPGARHRAVCCPQRQTVHGPDGPVNSSSRKVPIEDSRLKPERSP